MQGTISKYFTERGFGFIKPDASRTDVFFHISAMAPGSGEPEVGMIVEFTEEPDPRTGRLRAANPI
jgi:CspA family cold shock protein